MLVCQSVLKADTEFSAEAGFGMSSDLKDKGGEKSNGFSTSWTYTTSDNPAM